MKKKTALLAGLVLSLLTSTAHGQWLDTDTQTFGGDNFGGVDMYPMAFRDFTNTPFGSEMEEIVAYGVVIRRGVDTQTMRDFLSDAAILADMELMAALSAAFDNSVPLTEEQCDQVGGLADFFRNMVDTFQASLDTNEWGAMLISNNNSVSFYRSQLYSDGSNQRVSHSYSTSDAPNIVSVLHNHPAQGGNIDLQNRYPSNDDWSAAGSLISSGADASSLTLGVVGPDGQIRMFSYSDRAAYQALSDSQKESGQNLPDAVPEGAVAEPCVKLE